MIEGDKILTRWRRWQQQVGRFLRRENLDRLLLLTVILIGLSSMGLAWAEPQLSLADSLWWSIVTMTTVGYGDIAPTTVAGRAIAVVNMVIGIGILAALSATLASILVNRKLKEELGMSAYDVANHMILCEWNHRAAVILRELRSDRKTWQSPIVLIAALERKPVDDDNLFFVRGQVSDETLKQANLAQASTVIILGDDHLDDTARDAKVVLSTLTVESLNPNAYTIVELVDQAHVITCQRARANEIIVSSDLSSKLISQAALNHGITKVVSEMLSFQVGQQLYKIPMPKSRVGCSFVEVLTYMKHTYQSLVVAVQKGTEGEVVSNPPADYPLEAGDYLIVLAQDHPIPLERIHQGR